MEDVIKVWADDFGRNVVDIIRMESPDEDGNIAAPFEMETVIGEFSERYGVPIRVVERPLMRTAASACISALLDAGYDPLNVSVMDTMIVVVTDPLPAGFELV